MNLQSIFWAAVDPRSCAINMLISARPKLDDCSLCSLRFEPCGCLYDGYWRFTWSLTSGPVGLVEVRAS
jgi:hypothetical protein